MQPKKSLKAMITCYGSYKKVASPTLGAASK